MYPIAGPTAEPVTITVLCCSEEIVAIVKVVDHTTPDIALIALTAMILLNCDHG